MAAPVTVLGAGIVGICTALSLAERGISARVIDRDAPGQATSFGNAGVVSPWSVIPQSVPGIWRKIPQLIFGQHRPLSVHPRVWPQMVPWGLRFLREARVDRVRAAADAMSILCGPSIDLYRRHLSGTGAETLIRDAIYVHAFRDASRARITGLDYALRQEKGAELEVIGADALRRLEPALSPDFKAAVLVKGQARVVSPGRVGTVLAEKARALGVVFVRDEVTSLQRADTGWRVACRAQSFESETVVLAMGIWSHEVMRALGVPVPLMAERGYHVSFANPGVEPTHSIFDVDAKVVASAMEDGLRLAGQAEFAPIDAPPDPRKQQLLTRIAQAAFPALRCDDARLWMGRRPSFPDSLPALGPVKGLDGLIANFGHAHHGLMMAPKSGELVADLVTMQPSNQSLSAFDPVRFS